MASSSLQYTMAVPIVFFLFFCPTSSADEPSLIFKLTNKTNLVEGVCGNDTICGDAVRRLNLQPPKTHEDIIQLGFKISNFSKEKAQEGKTYIDTLKKQHPKLADGVLSQCSETYDRLFQAYGSFDRGLKAEDKTTLDYDLCVGVYDNFRCSDDEFKKQGLSESPMAAKNIEIKSLNHLLYKIALMVQGS